MFNIFSWQHLLILAVIALVVVGPADLPRLMHRLAKWVTKGRSMASELRRNLEEMTRTTDLDGLRAELNALKRKHPLSSLETGSFIDHRAPRG